MGVKWDLKETLFNTKYPVYIAHISCVGKQMELGY